MTITVSTSKLIDALTDSLQTADNRGVHLATLRGPWRAEPGDRDLLAFTSGNKYMVGHTWIPVDGKLFAAAVWPVASTVTLIAVCRRLLAIRGKEHTVDLTLTRAHPAADAKDDEHPGWVITLSETPALFASDTEFQFHAHHEDRINVQLLRRVLQPPAELPIEAEADANVSALTLWSPSVMAPLVKVASRRGMYLQCFRSPFRRIQVVQIGDTWIGAATPAEPLPGEHGEQPSIEPVLRRELWDDAAAKLGDVE